MTTTNMFLNFGGKWDSPPSLNNSPDKKHLLTTSEMEMCMWKKEGFVTINWKLLSVKIRAEPH